MRVRRDISSIPQRSASETWQQILCLITGPTSQDVQQLRAAGGIVEAIITDEHLAAKPILLEGVGAQLRIYCRYGVEAIEAGNEIDPLGWNPTAGEWTMHVPCDHDNLDWVTASLAKTSPRIKVFDVAEEERAESEVCAKSGSAEAPIVVDWNLRG
jgi:hypothetical protein